MSTIREAIRNKDLDQLQKELQTLEFVVRGRKAAEAAAQGAKAQAAELQRSVAALRQKALRLAVARGMDARDAGVRVVHEGGKGALDRAATIAARRELKALQAQVAGLQARIEAFAATAVAPPLADYDERTAKDLAEQLGKLTLWQAEAVRRYEAAHKGRVTVLRAAEARLEVAA